MAYLLFKEKEKKQGNTGHQIQCTSAIFNYQVLGDGEVLFSGSNVPDADPNNDDHWIDIVTITAQQADTEPFRQHCWNAVRWKVVSGTSVDIYVTSGVAG